MRAVKATRLLRSQAAADVLFTKPRGRRQVAAGLFFV